MADVRLPISRAQSLPSLADPRRGPSFTQAPRFGREPRRSRPPSAPSAPSPPGAPGAPQDPASPGRGYTDQPRPAAPEIRAKEWKPVTAAAVPELLPPEVVKEIRRIAAGGGIVIEMLWGSSAYLPAHNGGKKYRQNASQLQELLAGKLSRGSPLPVHVVDKPIPFKKGPSGPRTSQPGGIFDQFSDWERKWELVASNRSFAAAPASRVGAFEVHLIHQQQHTILHSKLWTRHWPDFVILLTKIGTMVIQEPPDVKKPVVVTAVSFVKQQCQRLHCGFTLRQSLPMISGFPDRLPAIEQELAALLSELFSCSCGWTVVGERSKVVVEETLKAHHVESPCTVTLLWGLDGNPHESDLDLMTTVDGTKLYFNTPEMQVGKCKLDIDMNDKESTVVKEPAENISLGQEGTFVIEVTNYANRDGTDIPFKVLVRRSGHVSEAEIYDRVWPKDQGRDTPMEICTVTVSAGDLERKDLRLERVRTCDYPISRCSCGQKLELHRVSSILQNHGFSAEDFESFASENRDACDGRPLREFIGKFVEKQQEPVRREHQRKKEAAEERFLELRESCRAEENRIRKDYADEFEKGNVEAEKIYVQLCLHLVRKVPAHNLDVSRLQNGEASAQEANEKLMAAIRVNEERRDQLSSWFEEVNSWRSDDEVFQAILQQRPDIQGLVVDEKEELDKLDGEIHKFQEKMQKASREHNHPETYQRKMDELSLEFDAHLADCLQSFGLVA